MTRVPETASVLQKSRLPFGIVIHPFKDLPVREGGDVREGGREGRDGWMGEGGRGVGWERKECMA